MFPVTVVDLSEVTPLWGRTECVAEADTRGALHCQMVTPRLVLRTEQVPFTQEWTTEKVVGSE